MVTAIIDYGSGNLRSAEKSFQRMASDPSEVIVTSDPELVRKADRIVLPGVGAFADCHAGLMSCTGMFECLQEAVTQRGTPFLGICVGMQLMASVGREHGNTSGFGWIDGAVEEIKPDDATLKIPHMGWNSLKVCGSHAVFDGIKSGDHAYFVHSYHLNPTTADHVIATVEHGAQITAAVARDNMLGTQFHPEKSQATGLKMIENFLRWSP